MERMGDSEYIKQPILDDVACITIIQEFLLYKKLKKTCEMLRIECSELGISCPSGDQELETSMSKEDAQTLIAALHSENFNLFFENWDVKIPAALRAADPEARRLIFLCHVASAARSGTEGMERLKSYFLSHSDQTLSRDPEILHYYALPFVTDPQHHPAFQHLYKQDGWWSEVKSAVGIFVRQITTRDSGPCLPLIRFGHCIGGNHGNVNQLRRKCKQIQTDYHRLLGVAGELTSALELTARGEVIDLSTTLSNCTKIFPELFPTSQYRSSPESVLRRSITAGRSVQLSTENVADLELDFRKVRAHLASPQNTKTRLLLMQALRWRISQSSPEERDASVAAMIRHDLLGLKGGFCLLELLTSPDGETPHPLQQGVARLVNALASLRSGRDYLSSPPEDQVVGVASACLTGRQSHVKFDDVTAEMLLALLQKLSLRRCHRETMISAGLVEWLVPRLEEILETLKTNPDGSTYALEYATALLMNLCLHSRAKQRCIPLSGRALQLLAAMLGSAPLQALPYVNGALYSLLCEPLINQQARHMGLDKLLLFYLKSSAETVEEEVDSFDPVRAESEMSGERLLHSQYRVLFPARGPQQTNLQNESSQQNLNLQQGSQPRLTTPLPTGMLENQRTEPEKDVTSERSMSDEISLKSNDNSTIPDFHNDNISISISSDYDKNPADGTEDNNIAQSKIDIKYPDLTTKLLELNENIADGDSNSSNSLTSEETIVNKNPDTGTEDGSSGTGEKEITDVGKNLLDSGESTVSLSEKLSESADSETTKQKSETNPESIFNPKPLLARTPPPGSPATSRLQELSKSVAQIQNAITKLN